MIPSTLVRAHGEMRGRPQSCERFTGPPGHEIVSDYSNYSVTTGEKWDSLTRSWEEHEQILAQIQLFLVDEVRDYDTFVIY